LHICTRVKEIMVASIRKSIIIAAAAAAGGDLCKESNN